MLCVKTGLRLFAAAGGIESVSAVHAVIWDLGYHKLCFLWVPHQLMHIYTRMSYQYLQDICSCAVLRVMCFIGGLWQKMRCGVTIFFCTWGKTSRHAVEIPHFTQNKEIVTTIH
jgi:hypothetical protein